jgi:hypothetical protein
MLAVHGVDVLQVVAAGHALYPDARDVRAGDRLFPAAVPPAGGAKSKLTATSNTPNSSVGHQR